MGWGPRQSGGGEWVKETQAEKADDYVPPIPDNPPPEASTADVHRRKTLSIRLVVVVALVATAVLAILLLAGIL
ncbi:MAG: hypothetical protein WCB19_08435 [Thermoplasmata archaeon]